VLQQERDPGAAVARTLVDEVHACAVDLGAEVGERVQLPLLLAPVEALGPVIERKAQVVELGSLIPPDPRDLIRPARRADARAQVVEDLVGYVDREGFGLRFGSLRGDAGQARERPPLTM
jgi:hypothetical protein